MNGTGRSPYWHGMLCSETRDQIADRMREVLDGHWFTVVTGNSYSEESERFTAIEVYPSQFLSGPIRHYASDQSVAGIAWCVPRLSMGVHSTAKTPAEAREGKPHQYTQFIFEPDRVVIDHYAPAGYRLQWIFAVERHDSEMSGAPEGDS